MSAVWVHAFCYHDGCGSSLDAMLNELPQGAEVALVHHRDGSHEVVVIAVRAELVPA